jgi:hypothetical protein
MKKKTLKDTELVYTVNNKKYHNPKKGKISRYKNMIINRETALECSEKETCQLKPFCKKNGDLPCYGILAETVFKDSYPFHKRQEKQWDEHSSNWFVQQIQHVQECSTRKFTHFRFNEVGGIRGVIDMLKIATIASQISKLGIVTFMYTTRKDIWELMGNWITEHTSLVVNGSGFMAHNNYKVVPEDYVLQQGEIFCNDNCHICRACKGRNGLTICSKIRHDTEG